MTKRITVDVEDAYATAYERAKACMPDANPRDLHVQALQAVQHTVQETGVSLNRSIQRKVTELPKLKDAAVFDRKYDHAVRQAVYLLRDSGLRFHSFTDGEQVYVVRLR